MHLIDHFALRPELTIEHNYCEAKTKSNNKRVELKRDAIPKMTATNSSDMSTEVNTIASCADIEVQNQVLSTSTDQGNKTQAKQNYTRHCSGSEQRECISCRYWSGSARRCEKHHFNRGFQMDRGPRDKSIWLCVTHKIRAGADSFFQSHNKRK